MMLQGLRNGQSVYIMLSKHNTYKVEVVTITATYLHCKFREVNGSYTHHVFPWEAIQDVAWSDKP